MESSRSSAGILDDEWYCRYENSIEGPFSSRELKARYIAREICRSTEVWSPASHRWQEFSSTPFFSNLPSMPVEGAEEKEVQEEFKSPFGQIGTILVACAVFVGLVCLAGRLLGASAYLDFHQKIFVIYCAGYAGLWFVYFMSRHGPRFFHVVTLRRALRVSSAHWVSGNLLGWRSELETSYQEKARSSITATAMFAAMAGLLLSQVRMSFSELQQRQLVQGLEIATWDQSLLGFAAFFALLSLVCFIISVDSLDALFNKFKDREFTQNLYRYFYYSTINTRYFGLVFLLTGTVLLIGYESPLIGCSALGLIIGVGFRHWFPRFKDIFCESRLVSFNEKIFQASILLIRTVVLAGAPLLLLNLDS